MSEAGSSALSWPGVVAGAMLGLGLLLVIARLRARRIRLDHRVGPYLRVLGTGSTLLQDPAARSGVSSLDRAVAPWVAEIGRLFERAGSTRAVLRRRLDQAGRPESVDQFRAQQVVWGVLALAAGIVLALFLAATRGSSPVVLTALVAFCGLGGVLGCDHRLTRQIARREERMLMEFPTIAELLALSVGAGEGPVAAMERVATMAKGEMSVELGLTLASVRSGAPLARALEGLADRTSLASLTRFAEGVAVAVERGTPLADVLRAQAQDVREAGRRALMESGGRKEVLMMVPVVFLILPVTVCFAIFPSLMTLRIGM